MNNVIIVLNGNYSNDLDKEKQILAEINKIKEIDAIYFADGGYSKFLAENTHAKKKIFVGDLDSVKDDLGKIAKEILPVEKDDTDFGYIMKNLPKITRHLTIFNLFGGRVSMELANLQTLKGTEKKYKRISFFYFANDILKRGFIIKQMDNLVLNKTAKTFSVLSLGKTFEVEIKNAKYNYKGCILDTFPIGISNVAVDDFTYIENIVGDPLIIFTDDSN